MSNTTTTTQAWQPVDQDGNVRAIPLTPPGALWSQREYVEASRSGIGFTAHGTESMRQWFHYAFPGDVGCTSVLIEGTRPLQYVDHTFKREPGWIALAARAVRRIEL